MSLLLKKARDLRTSARWTCGIGVALLPVMGFGAILIAGANEERARAKAIEDMVREIYGDGDKLDKLSALIRNELRLFKTAMFAVNAEIKDGRLIHRDMMPFVMICSVNPRARRLFALKPDAEPSKELQEYASMVNSEYCRLGGNEAVLLYGVAEYMMIRAVSDDVLNFYVDSLIDDSAMRAEVLSFRRVIEPLLV